MHRIRVHSNQHTLETSDGKPFFWLGDTAWELVHRLNLAETEHYLNQRAAQGFNLVQFVILAEHDGLNTPNANGDLPLHDLDPTRPNEAYFRHVDTVLDMLEARGLYAGLLPTWGDKVIGMWGIGPEVFNPANARVYGAWLGQRYKHRTNIVWVLGGDRPAMHQGVDLRPVWDAMAAGILEATGEDALITYHPNGSLHHQTGGTSPFLHSRDWLHVNALQSGHGGGRDAAVWEAITRDYHLQPTKPVLDMEPNYEDHPVNPWPSFDPANGYFRAFDVRKQVYRSVFAGACGVTYGHQSVWQFYAPSVAPMTFPDRTWLEALQRPGAEQMRYLRALIESRPFHSRIPDQGLLTSDPGLGSNHVRATRDADGGYGLVYIPNNQTVTVNLERLSGDRVRAWWFSPRTGKARMIGEYDRAGTRTFTTPLEEPPTDLDWGPDWVLVLDDVARGFDTPGLVSSH